MTTRPSLLAVFAAVLLASALALMPWNAVACSTAPGWNPARESEVIIAGRVTRMELASPPSAGDPARSTQPVRLTFAVDRYLKGTGPSALQAIDPSSVTFMNNETPKQMARFEGASYFGASGVCGALHADPRGRYVVFGLSRAADGTLRTNLLLTFGVGSGPTDPVIVEALARAEAALQAVPPVVPPTATPTVPPTAPRPAATGQGASTGGASVLPAISLGAVLAFVALGRLVARRVAQSGRPR